jgi:LuxR family transcriptional activator of conjugal transfer of Ti plasmids
LDGAVGLCEQDMNAVELSFQEFIDALQTGDDDRALERIAARVTGRIGFRWFAYLSFTELRPRLISSYPKTWTAHYLARSYQRIDPVVQRAARECSLFAWDATVPRGPRTSEQSRFLDEAMGFRIRIGVTMPIISGYGRRAAFTFASDERSEALNRTVGHSADVLGLIGLYFHTHVALKNPSPMEETEASTLTQRERQCLAWAARGKTSAEIASIIGITPRTVHFHIANARRKLDASSLSQTVATAVKRGLLP